MVVGVLMVRVAPWTAERSAAEAAMKEVKRILAVEN